MRAARWMRRLCLLGVLLCFTVVVLGAYVRLTAAGLGCPDWPGCYGHLTPAGAQTADSAAAFPGRPLEPGKAWREMIHRYAATTLGLLIITLAALAVATRREHIVSVRYAVLLFATVVVQGLLGMLTVTWQLKPLIVTLHLLFGMTTLALLWWLALALRRDSWHAPSRGGAAAQGLGRQAATTRAFVHGLALLGLGVLVLQIALGGWTSSNYAALACPDVPTCQGRWWPHTDYRNAFVLWRGLNINYEGGVLANPARVAIHLTHRVGALLTTAVLASAALSVLRRRALQSARLPAAAVLVALAVQLTIGVSMVLRAFPLWLATAHTAGAALLLLATLALLRALTPR